MIPWVACWLLNHPAEVIKGSSEPDKLPDKIPTGLNSNSSMSLLKIHETERITAIYNHKDSRKINFWLTNKMFSASNLKRFPYSPNIILLTIQSCLTVRRPRIHAVSGSISARYFKNSTLTKSPRVNSVADSFIPAPPFVTAKKPRFLRFPCIRMVEAQKRFHSTDKKHGGVANRNHETKHTTCSHRNGEENGNAHSFSIFGHSHEEEHGRDADQLIAALKGSGERYWGQYRPLSLTLPWQETVAVTSLLSDSSLISPLPQGKAWLGGICIQLPSSQMRVTH